MISELSRFISNMPKEEAEKFISNFFQVLLYGLEKDKTVKIKGLGTFKLTKAKTKLSFSPDITMRDTVNRPFSQFEAVLLNDGVLFDDVEEEECDDFSVAEKIEETEQDICFVTSAVMEKLANKHSLAAQQSSDTLNNHTNEEEKQTENQVVEEKVEAIEKVSSTKEDEPSVDEKSSEEETVQTLVEEPSDTSKKRWWIAAVAACLIAGLCFLLFYPRNHGAENVADATAPTAADSTLVAATVADSIRQAEAAAETQAKYDELNAKIPYGAYEIVGVDTIITVSKGMDLNDIARIFLGTTMQVYLVVMNDGNDSPTEGQSYKIPRLKLK